MSSSPNQNQSENLKRIAVLEEALSAFVNWKTDEKGTKSLLDDDELWANAEAALFNKT